MFSLSDQRWFLVLIALAMTITTSGCAAVRNWMGWAPPPPVLCALPEDSTAPQIVDHLNTNINKLRGWRTTRAAIKAHGNILVPQLDATIVVEPPRNFRLVARNNLTGGNEVDFGSNIEQFWFWVRRNEDKQVIVASHDLDPERMRRFPFPFQPDWIMETMGVIPLNSDEELKLQPGPTGSHLVSLIADRTSPQGFKVRKVTVVNLQHGVISEHALYDARNQLIAKAQLSKYVRDQKSDALVPKQIVLEWPQAQVGLTMTLSDFEGNPAHFSQNTWKLPSFPPGYEIYDLSR